jgi:hypothetical protein
MTDLVGLLYRADWSRLSLTAEVSVRRDLDLDRIRYEHEMPPPGEAEGVPPWQLFRDFSRRQRAEREWEMATDQLGTEAHRSTLLIQPGRRYREQGEDFASGCDGERSWTAIRKDGRVPPGASRRRSSATGNGSGGSTRTSGSPTHPGGPPPHEIAKLLDPSWLLEHRLTGGAETTVGDRRGYRFAVAADAPMDGFPFSVDDVVADADANSPRYAA